jgi:hypothetical protein
LHTHARTQIYFPPADASDDDGWELYGGEGALGLALGAQALLADGGTDTHDKTHAARLAAAAGRALAAYARKWRAGEGAPHTATFYANWHARTDDAERVRLGASLLLHDARALTRRRAQADAGGARDGGGGARRAGGGRGARSRF